jgi:hypothetical protein
MDKVVVEVLGTVPPCSRCNLAFKTVEKAVSKLNRHDLEIQVEKRNCSDRETIRRFGVIVPPAVAINGVLRIAGRIPNESEVKTLIEKAVS